MAQCEQCGHANRDSVRFCTQCGSALAVQPVVEAAAEPAAAVKRLADSGLNLASRPDWGTPGVSGRQVALDVRAAALAEQALGLGASRGDIAARLALAMVQGDLPMSARVVMQRDSRGEVTSWGALAGGPDFEAFGALRESGGRAPKSAEPGQRMAAMLAAAGGRNGD